MSFDLVAVSEDTIEAYYYNEYKDPITNEVSEVAIDLTGCTCQLWYKLDGVVYAHSLAPDGDQTTNKGKAASVSAFSLTDFLSGGAAECKLYYVDTSTKKHKSEVFYLSIDDDFGEPAA
jgi:hypothetical protein